MENALETEAGSAKSFVIHFAPEIPGFCEQKYSFIPLTPAYKGLLER